MNKDLQGSIQLLQDLKSHQSAIPGQVKVIVCPPYTALTTASEILKGTSIALGAQNMYFEDEGAFTGEISAAMLKSSGCTYVILGHSERRQIFGETNELINRKVRKALAVGLIPIVCVGETLEEREKNITDKVVTTQVKAVLRNIAETDLAKLIVAYEPVWAIGTGKNASPDQAQEVHGLIRKLVSQLYSWATAEKLVIQYGGSVKPENSSELLRQPDIDGALVGGACLKADVFLRIIRSGKL